MFIKPLTLHNVFNIITCLLKQSKNHHSSKACGYKYVKNNIFHFAFNFASPDPIVANMKRSSSQNVSTRFANLDVKEIRCFNENPRDESWTSHERHFFIITDAARPVYCRYGNEVNVTPILCTVVAFTGQLQRDGGQILQTIVAGDKLFVFYLPFPFIFVCVSSVKLPVSLLKKELMMLEQIIFSILSPTIKNTLIKRPNFNIKNQTLQNERHFTSLLELMDQSHTFVFNSCFPMAALDKLTNREKLARIVYDNFDENIFACIVLYLGELFFYVEGPNFKFTPDDFIILLNNSFPKNNEDLTTFEPLWLPNREDMFQVITYDAQKDFDFTMILITDSIENQPKINEAGTNIIEQFKKQLSARGPTLIEPLENPDIFNFVVANKQINQVYSPYIESPDLCKKIYRNYAWLNEYLNSSHINGNFYLVTEELTLFGFYDHDKTLIAATHLGCPASKAQVLLDEVVKYVNDNRDELFYSSPLKWSE